MNWHNGLNWKKHLAQRERQREAYRQAGMTEAQIAAMEEFDDEVFRSDRRFYMHNISPQDEVKHNIALFHSCGIEEGTVDAGAGAGVYRGRRAGQPLNPRDDIVFGIVGQLENLAFCVFDFQCKKAEQMITSPF